MTRLIQGLFRGGLGELMSRREEEEAMWLLRHVDAL